MTGGGTGGHVIPNLAVIEELKGRKGVELLYIGSRKGIERKLMLGVGVKYRGIFCGKWRRYFSFENFVDIFKIPIGIVQALVILKRFKPSVVFSKGGFVSMPVVIAASWLGVPVILHESDVMPGLANKICARFAKKICLSFEESRQYFAGAASGGGGRGSVTVTGNPVRKSLLKGNSDRAYKLTGLRKDKPIILVMGGSQGSEQINELIRASIDELLQTFQIIHIRGRGNLDISLHKKGYVQYEYINENLRDVYAIGDIVVCRGGANSLAEIAMLKKKAVIIPLGTNASRGDQLINARVFAEKFGWEVVSGNVSDADFLEAIEKEWKEDLRDGVVKNGVRGIVKLILKFE